MTDGGGLERSLLAAHRFLRRGPVSEEGWSQLVAKDRDWERSYRGRWAHDKVVRSTHGVNCTGSCSWNVFVKDGIVTWESQAVDYPSTGAGHARVRAAGLSTGSVVLLVSVLAAAAEVPVRPREPASDVPGGASAARRSRRSVDRDRRGSDKARLYRRQRGKGGFVRASWDEAVDIIAAAHVHTIRRYGPDRVVGFSPIPAMSMASYAAGSRFLSLIGGTILSFYDWYADLPPASPQSFGDQTDVPESGDWWNAGYLIVWGTNLPTTRTPDAHFMTEARYRGQKVVVVSPDYAEHTKFADRLAARGAGLGRRAGNGDGPRDPQGVLRRPPSAVLPRLRAAVHRLAVARDAARARGRLCERPVVASLGPRERRRRVGARRVETRRARRSDGRARRSARLGWSPLRRAGPMEPAARRDRAGADAARPRHRAGPGRPAALRRRRGGRRGDAARRTRAPARRSPGHDGVRPAARPIRRRPRGTARAMAGGVRRPRAAHAGMAGADHLGRPAPGGAGGTRVRSQRGDDPRPLDDRDGRRHQSLVPLRPDVPARSCRC